MRTEADLSYHPAITISCTLGSGGAAVGVLVARQLGWRFCDRHILRQTALALDLPVASLPDQDERSIGFLEQLLNFTAFAPPDVPYAAPLELPVYSQELFNVESQVMRGLVEYESAVLVGRGGFIVLKDRPATFHVRIQASLGYRIQHMLETGRAPDAKAALRTIHSSDQNRTAFFRRVAGIDWNDPGHFHLVLDAGESNPHACAELITKEAKAQLNHR